MVAVATTITRPTMTEPGPADRLVALQRDRQAAPTSHAVAAKILTAGLSTSMVLGLVATLAHSAMQQEAADAAADVTLDPKDDGAGAVDLDAVIAVTLALGKAGKRPQLVELLEAYGVAKSSLLHKNDYAGFHAKATELLGE